MNDQKAPSGWIVVEYLFGVRSWQWFKQRESAVQHIEGQAAKVETSTQFFLVPGDHFTLDPGRKLKQTTG